MAEMKLGYSYIKYQYNVKLPFFWDTDTAPHCLIAGVTGGGKTVLSQIILNEILNRCRCHGCNTAMTINDIFICDFKADGDWSNIVPNYAEYTDCDNLLNIFYESFADTIHKKQHNEKYLIFDEFCSYALCKDTKGFKDLMAKISHLAFMGRSFGYHLIFISQQFNAKVIDTAIREQFGIKIYMGSTISPESANMLFPNCKIDNENAALPKCCGYISMPGRNLDIIQIPFISEPWRLKNLLIKKGQALTN